MSTQLESLHDAPFAPLTHAAAAQVVGGAAAGPGAYTQIGYAVLDGQLVALYAWDPAE